MNDKYLGYFSKSINDFKNENRYRKFVNISRIRGEFPYAVNNKNNQKIILWCSNDYLGMGQNQDAINEAKKALELYGVGSGGTRNISGTSKLNFELEKEICNIFNSESSLTFVSGYVANDATIQALSKIIPDLVIFSDEKNHASIISGVRNSRLEKNIFKHNDLKNLEELLKKYSISTPKIIIFESIYSMDGDFGNIKEIISLAKKYNAMTFCDEVHAVGLYGERGGGLCQELGLDKEIDVIQGTLAKAYGCIGGFITGKSEIIDAIRLNSSGFIFSTSLPPSICAAAKTNILHLINNSHERSIHKIIVNKLKVKLKEANINIIENKSHIISIRIGNARRAEEISRLLLEKHNIYIQHINYPTVAINDERLRITATPLHNEKMIDDLVTSLKDTIDFVK